MFYVYVDDQIESSYRSPVSADLRVKELALRGSTLMSNLTKALGNASCTLRRVRTGVATYSYVSFHFTTKLCLKEAKLWTLS